MTKGWQGTTTGLSRAAGLDTAHVDELGYAAADDAFILQLGKDEGRVVVTLDAHFPTLLALSAATASSVTRIRYRGITGSSYQPFAGPTPTVCAGLGAGSGCDGPAAALSSTTIAISTIRHTLI